MKIKSLLDYKAQDLLELIAGGSTTPGAGSSAALLGAVAASLAQTVAFHTLKAARSGKRREAYAQFRDRAETLLAEAALLSERLGHAVDDDTVAFDLFWEKRTEEAQRLATEVPIAISMLCVEVAEIALELYDHGAQSSQGEAIAAFSGALAGGETAAHVAHLNLKFAGAGDWAESRKEEVRDLRKRLRNLRKDAEARIYDQDG